MRRAGVDVSFSERAMLRELTSRFLRSVPIDNVMSHLKAICAFDRYQASLGIEQAADFVAETASAVGLVDVRVERFPADGLLHWWTFRAPVSWTPLVARLTITTGCGTALEIDHAQQPFSVATHSAPAQARGANARLVTWHGDGAADLAGAIAIVRRPVFERAGIVDALRAARALGFVTDGPVRSSAAGLEHAGRIELEPDSQLFAFSVTHRQLDTLEQIPQGGACANVI